VSSNRKLLVVVGTTSSGKTKLGLTLCRLFGGEIVSADSRQIYRGMDIGTGKDIQENFEFRISNLEFKDRTIGYYSDDSIRLWGYDLLDPKEDFSVSKFLEFANEIIPDIWMRNKLPIIVGGTGFYIKVILDGIDTISIPPNQKLRKNLKDKTADELYKLLLDLDKKNALKMNSSDKKNPRRLIRAIEISKYVTGKKFPSYASASAGRQVTSRKALNYESLLMIGLTASRPIINKTIERRVKERLNAGFEKEVLGLLKSGVGWESKSMQGMGYRQYKNLSEGKISRERFIDDWISEESKYAKRQMTWFQKDKRINWYDICAKDFEKRVENIIRSWYYENVEEKK